APRTSTGGSSWRLVAERVDLLPGVWTDDPVDRQTTVALERLYARLGVPSEDPVHAPRVVSGERQALLHPPAGAASRAGSPRRPRSARRADRCLTVACERRQRAGSTVKLTVLGAARSPAGFVAVIVVV